MSVPILSYSAKFFLGQQKVIITGVGRDLGVIALQSTPSPTVRLIDGTTHKVNSLTSQKTLLGDSIYAVLFILVYDSAEMVDEEAYIATPNDGRETDASISITITNQPASGARPQLQSLTIDDGSPQDTNDNPTIPKAPI